MGHPFHPVHQARLQAHDAGGESPPADATASQDEASSHPTSAPDHGSFPLRDLSYHALPDELRPLADKFYRGHRSRMRCGAQDKIWVARDRGGIIAILCLRPMTSGHWLRSLFVDPQWRARGLARLLMRHALPEGRIWLFCDPPLDALYRPLGFTPCEALPQELAERLLRYRRSRTLIALSR